MKRHKAIGDARPFAIPQNTQNGQSYPLNTRIYANSGLAVAAGCRKSDPFGLGFHSCLFVFIRVLT